MYLVQLQNLLGLSDAAATSLKMRSRLYYFCRFNSSVPNEPPLAVVLVESEDKDRFGQDDLQRIFEGEEAVFLTDLLVRVSPAATHRWSLAERKIDTGTDQPETAA